MLLSVVTGVGINFKPRESRVICASVSCSFDRFLMCFLCDSDYVVVTHFPFVSMVFFSLSVENRFIFLLLMVEPVGSSQI